MGRLFLFLGLLAVAVAMAVFLLSIWRGFYAAGQNIVGPMLRASEGDVMTPNGIQKVAYAALLVLLFGLCTGLIGGGCDGMAQRYGGKYSPETEAGEAPPPRGAYDGARPDPVGARANALFLPAIPLVALSLTGGAARLVLGLSAAAILTLAAWLLREGLRAEAAYHARKVARRPALPRKMAASLLTGLGAGIAAYWAEPGLVAPLLFGAVALVLHGTAFGIDPLRDKGMAGIDTFQQDRVARVVTEAETHLRAMSDAIGRAGDRQMQARVERFQTTARDLFRTVEEDPRDLTAARRYMTVYLMGARDATIKFADIWLRTRDTQARADYAALLDDLEQNFAARTRKMLLDDRSDLTVEIEVLRERLQREGVRTDTPPPS